MLKGSESSSIYIDPAKYPLARKDPTIVEDFHGTKVPDPYRWLEDPDSDETKAYVDKLNAVSEPFIGASPIREKMRKKLIELWDYEKYGCTSKHGQYYYHFYNPGLHNQSKRVERCSFVNCLFPGKFIQRNVTECSKCKKNNPVSCHSLDYFSLLYQQKTLQDKGVVFLDPNKLSLDGTTSIRVQTFTRDGSILAYGISHKGSDWMTLKVILFNSNFNLN
ncbi:unnamed protein product [Anisakis simplex]|uniref:Peptidase_S9_N domain-containing protein n=1 Tax=Anisakis simplex TaxID=6269 RepID=A0A0M3J2H8_ANISI|nr:unnamed protein product [Anisakis simplex]